MPPGFNAEAVLRQEIRELAYDMVQLEQWAREAYARRNWMRVGELNSQRDELRERRSALMREVWKPRRSRYATRRQAAV
jgi:hypothetical protein